MRWRFPALAAIASLGLAPATGQAGQSNIGQPSHDAEASLQWTHGLSRPGFQFRGDQPFTVCGWVFQTPADFAAAERTHSILEADGLLRLSAMYSSGPPRLRAEVRLEDGSIVTAALDDFLLPGGALVHGEWVFVAASWLPATSVAGGRLTLRARTVAPLAAPGDNGIDGYRLHEAIGPVGVAGGEVGPRGIRYGAIPDNPTTLRTWKGVRAMFILAGAIAESDFHAMFESRSPTAPYYLAEHVGLAGASACLWTPVFHPSIPVDGLFGPDVPTVGVIGDPVTATNLTLFNRIQQNPDDPLHWRITRPVTIGDGAAFTHVDLLAADQPWSTGFLQARPDDAGLVQETSGELGPSAALVARREHDRVLRLLHGSNSRGVRISDATGRSYPEQHSHGFIRAHEADQAGALNIPVTLTATTWFGQDTRHGGALWSSGPIERIERPSGPIRSFQRLWSGGNFLNADQTVGSGGGVLLGPGATVQLVFHPESGALPGLAATPTKLTATDPASFEFYAMLHGGGSEMTVTPVAGTALDEPAPAQVDNMTPQVVPGPPILWSGVLDEADQLAADQWILAGTHPAIREGHFCLVRGDGLVTSRINRVAEVLLNDPEPGWTTLIFAQPWPDHASEPVVAGDLAEFAAADVNAYRTSLLGEPGANTHRGVRVENTGQGVIAIFAQSYWIDGAVGEINGPFGRAGLGWTDQIDAMLPGAHERMFKLLRPDVTYLYTASQGTTGLSLPLMTDLVRAGWPTSEVVWFMPSDLPTVGAADWDQVATDDALTGPADVYGLSVRESALAGDFFEMAARGGQADEAHYSAHGCRVIADAGLALMVADASATSCAADVTGDGTVDLFDLLVVLGAWGLPHPQCDVAPPGGDGVVNGLDLQWVLTRWGPCP